MLCNKCGIEVKSNAKFCTNCGNNLGVSNFNDSVQQPIQQLETIIQEKNNFVSTEQNLSVNNNYQQPLVDNSKKSKNGLAIASLVLGIVAIVLSLFINVLIFPLAITGLILGIVNKNKCGQKIAGIILNSLSMVIAIGILIIFLLLPGFVNNSLNESYSFNPVEGVWNCKSFSGSGLSSDYIITMKLNNDSSFSWSKYGDEYNNHIYGTYTYEDENKTNDSGDYKYYTIDLVGEEFVNNGVLQTEDYISQYEMGINEDYGEAIIMNVSTYNMYYCYLEY